MNFRKTKVQFGKNFLLLMLMRIWDLILVDSHVYHHPDKVWMLSWHEMRCCSFKLVFHLIHLLLWDKNSPPTFMFLPFDAFPLCASSHPVVSKFFFFSAQIGTQLKPSSDFQIKNYVNFTSYKSIHINPLLHLTSMWICAWEETLPGRATVGMEMTLMCEKVNF